MNQNMETKTLAMTKATTKMRKPRMGKAKKISVTLSLMMKLMMAGKVPVEVVNTIINMVVPKDELRKAVAMADGFFQDGMAKRGMYNLRLPGWDPNWGNGGRREFKAILWNEHVMCFNLARDTILEVTKKYKHLILDKRRYTKASFNHRRYSGDEWTAAMHGGFNPVKRQLMIENERNAVDGVDRLIDDALRELSAWL
jgi:hypothetical protein